VKLRVVGGSDHRDGGEHGPGAGDEDRTEAQAQDESPPRGRRLGRVQAEEGALEDLRDGRHQQADAEQAEEHQPGVAEQVLGSPRALSTVVPRRVMTLKLITRPITTATERHRREAGAVPVGSRDQNHGQHRQDAGRDAGYESRDEADENEADHNRSASQLPAAPV